MIVPNTYEHAALAELCFENGLYKDARNFIETIIIIKSPSKTPLTVAEATILIECWSNESGPLVSVQTFSRKDASASLKNFQIKLARDTLQLSNAYVKLVDRCLLLNNSEYVAAYYKAFKGTLQLIGARNAPGDKKLYLDKHSLEKLEEANEWAIRNLGLFGEMRLKIAVALSVFYFNRNDESRAIGVARKTYDECMKGRRQYKDNMGREQQLEEASLNALTVLKEFLDSRAKNT